MMEYELSQALVYPRRPSYTALEYNETYLQRAGPKRRAWRLAGRLLNGPRELFAADVARAAEPHPTGGRGLAVERRSRG